jgi:hypothetical protein
MRHPCFVLSFGVLLHVGNPALAYELYTLSSDVPFELTIPGNGSVVKGTFHAATPADVVSWDLTTQGQDADAAAGTHACADLGFNPFASCPFDDEFSGCQADGFVFRLSLQGDSGPVSATSPDFSPLVATAFGGSAYIISASTADRVPVSSSSGGFQFHTSNDPAVFIQPAESTVWLISRYQCGAVATALGDGTTLRMGVRDNSVIGGIQFAQTPEVSLKGLISGTTTTTLPSGGGVCGDPVDPPTQVSAEPRAVTASDALFTLRAAVGTEVCDLCVCDVDSSGAVNATDALRVLRNAVGLPVALDCPTCG